MMRRFIVNLLTWLCIINITLLALIVLLQVVTRFFNYSIVGTDEISRLLIVWLTFLGTSLAFHEKMHLAVNFFLKKANAGYRTILHGVVNTLMTVFFAIIVIYGFKFSFDAMQYTSSALQLPMGIFYLALPVGGVFSLYFILTSFTASLTDDEGEVSP